MHPLFQLIPFFLLNITLIVRRIQHYNFGKIHLMLMIVKEGKKLGEQGEGLVMHMDVKRMLLCAGFICPNLDTSSEFFYVRFNSLRHCYMCIDTMNNLTICYLDPDSLLSLISQSLQSLHGFLKTGLAFSLNHVISDGREFNSNPCYSPFSFVFRSFLFRSKYATILTRIPCDHL